MRRVVLVLLVAALTFLPNGRSHAQQPLFSVESDLVVLHVTVTDRRGAYVQHLTRQSFTVDEDGRPQAISFLADADAPVTVGLLIDSSGSMMPTRELVIAAAAGFAQASNPQDEIFALAFNEHVRPALPPVTPFTSSPAFLQDALERAITARGRTALYDAVLAGLDYVGSGSRQRKVLVVVSDGSDNASTAREIDVFRAAQASNVLVYTLILRDTINPRTGNPRLLRELARATGGAAFAPSRPEEVADAMRRIAVDIRHTYTIGYVSQNGVRDGSFRHVHVSAASPDGRTLRVRSRAGYVAGSAR